MAARKVAVVFGGRSGEHEVSVTSARSIMAALDRSQWVVVPIGITRRGAWLEPGETQKALEGGARGFPEGGCPLARADAALGALAACDIAFPMVHGTYGEDGTLQGLLEMLDLPYAGCGVAASAIGMDKALMKALFREAGIPLPRYAVVHAWDVGEGREEVARFIEAEAGFPCFVKPANGGSSVGITKVRSREDLPAALAAAFHYDDKAVVEQAVVGQELEVSILGNERPEASIVGEVEPDREFYDYASKYDPDSKTKLHIPGRLTEVVAARVQELAIRMYEAMGCEGYARVDFFLSPSDDVVASEVNTIPGFTSISMYPKLWEASGLAYPELLSRILELGLERHRRRSRR